MKKSINYINIETGEQHPNIWEYIKIGSWKNINTKNFENNNLLGVLKRNEAKPAVGNFLPMYKGMIWLEEEKKIIDPTYVPTVFDATIEDFLEVVYLFFQKYQNKKIGVQLSGGLDSTIIIGLLKHFNIQFYLIGLSTKRYEFRTERHIQILVSNWAIETVLIDYEKYLPLSYIEGIPEHQYPDLSVNNYSSNRAMALECNRLGIEVLFTGDGGDNVFAESVPTNPEHCTWLPQSFGDCWLAENIYTPLGVDLVPFYEEPSILNTIYSLRMRQGLDNEKLWARQFFINFIPNELVDFTYCADFWGIYSSGFIKAIPKIKNLLEYAFDLTQNWYFSLESFNSFLSKDFLHADKEVYQKIESRVALAVWINSLKRIA